MKKEIKCVLPSAVIICCFGYAAYIFQARAIAREWHADISKFPNFLFDNFEWVELTTFQHIVGLIISLAILALLRTPILDFDNKLTITVASLCNVVGTFAMNVTHTMVNSSAARVIEVSQPLTTFAISVVLFKEKDSLVMSRFLSVLVIVLGMCRVVIQDMVHTGWDCLFAAALTSAFSLRNILLKQASRDTDGYLQKFGQMSLLSVIFVLPLWLIKLAFTQTFSFDWIYSLSGITYSIYSIASFTILESVDPITHAILAIIIKASTFTSVFNVIFSLKAVLGVCVILIGCSLYLQKDVMHILLKLIFVMLVTVFFFAPKPVFHHSISTRNTSYYENTVNFPKTNVSCERISTAWTYSAPIPEFVVSNIVILAEQNPSLPVHVFCGSKQCVEAVENRKTENMEVEFAVVSDILKGASPFLEQWLSRHPVNKVLAGREFETHLQEVTVIGILLKYGGVYISPQLTLSKNLSDTCLNSTPGWVSEELSQPNKNLHLVLDVCFFVKGHPFLYELGNVYEKEYHAQRKDESSGDILWKVWNTLWSETCTIEESCPTVSRNVPSVSSSTHTLLKLLRGKSHFGLITKSQIDSDTKMLQEFVEVQFLPFVDTTVNIDNFSVQSDEDHPRVLTFLHDLAITENRRLPSHVDPIMLSVQLEDGQEETIQILKEKEPIGCADSSTLKFLTDRNVTSFLSGSLMLLLNCPISAEKRESIYLSHLEDEVIKLLPAEIQNCGIHDESGSTISGDVFERFTAIHHMIEQYKSASLVITQCFHCASACAALGTPVIFIKTTDSISSEMTSLFHTLDLHNKTSDQARAWLRDFAWKNIPPNPDLGFIMKLRATVWNVIRQNQVLLDNAKKITGRNFGFTGVQMHVKFCDKYRALYLPIHLHDQ